MTVSPLTLWFVGNLLFFAASIANAGKAPSCPADSSLDHGGLLDVHGASVMQMGSKQPPKPASSPLKDEGSPLKDKANKVTGEIARKGLQETVERAQRWHQESANPSLIEGVKLIQARMPRESSSAKFVSVELAVNATTRYVKTLMDIGTHTKLGSYFDQFCSRFEVEDPVGTWTRSKKWELARVLQYRKNLLMPEGFSVTPSAITIAQEHAYAAVYSTMWVHNEGGDIAVNRSDLLTISPLGCIKRVRAYWSLGGTLLSTMITPAQFQTKETILGYLKALDELGQQKSLDYFNQFTEDFELHDPYGTAPLTMVAELQKVIPELATTVAPKGFTVTVKDVTVAADPKYGTAHLVLHLIGVADVDIIDIFEIENGKIKNLKAVWHIPGR